MAKKHASKKQAVQMEPSARQINGQAHSMESSDRKNGPAINSACHDALVSTLSTVDEIGAVFVVIDEDGICHVYSVVDQHNPEVALKIMTQEDKIQELFPTMLFNFRVRAAQGRAPSQAVPIHSQPLFIR
ncbi:MAG TPA: hypothetical protein VGZ25_13415 [Gemmataceae bacterium]|jgi:hypothetical protein|nr:hypothetical protein [Gemmataceae bacterium]